MINFDRLSEDFISLISSLDIDKEEFLTKVSNFNFTPVNYSNKIIQELTQENITFVKKNQFIKKEFDFWDCFNNCKTPCSSQILDF